MQQERRKSRRRKSDRGPYSGPGYQPTWGSIAFQMGFCALIFGIWWFCAGCASHIPKFAPTSVQVCAEYSRDRSLDEDFRRSRRLGASACLTFDDVSQSVGTSE